MVYYNSHFLPNHVYRNGKSWSDTILSDTNTSHLTDDIMKILHCCEGQVDRLPARPGHYVQSVQMRGLINPARCVP